MVAPIKFISTLLLATAGSAHAYRVSSNSFAMAPGKKEDDPTDALEVADQTINAAAEAYDLNSDMHLFVKGNRDEVLDVLCARAAEKKECRQQVTAYLERCRNFKCLTLDVERFPKDKEYQPLLLPDPYQLDAAFYVLQHSESDPLKKEVTEKMANLRCGGNCGPFHSFLIILTGMHFTDVAAADMDLEALVSRYVFMATLYFKAYTLTDPKYTKVLDKAAITRHLFGRNIQAVLKGFIKRNLPDDFGKYKLEVLEHAVEGYKGYLIDRTPELAGFAKRFAAMVTATLVKCVGDYQHLPWYQKMYRMLKDWFMAKVHKPAKSFVFDKMYGPAKEYYWTQVHHPFKKYYVERVRDPVKNYYWDQIHEPAKKLYKNRIHEPVTKFYVNQIHEPAKKFYKEGIHKPVKRLYMKGFHEPVAKLFTETIPNAIDRLSNRIDQAAGNTEKKDGEKGKAAEAEDEDDDDDAGEGQSGLTGKGKGKGKGGAKK
uniref:Rhoptry-associated protein-1b n=1 Tax=Babesia gibsoni TaxID=33632 RepID=C6L649_BABGI|nr:rhoptry-associated protein-1b [Babesia gibsoni]